MDSGFLKIKTECKTINAPLPVVDVENGDISINAVRCEQYMSILRYIVHVLTDVYSCKQIYAPFYNSLLEENLDYKMEQFKDESYGVNYYLYCEYLKEKNLLHILQEGKSCSLIDVFDNRLLNDRIKQLFEFEFAMHDMKYIARNEICTIDNTNELIISAPRMIKQWLGENSNIK